jgi:hypothetical protein
MYLIGYLVICYDMEAFENERNLILDRDGRLLPVVKSMI